MSHRDRKIDRKIDRIFDLVDKLCWECEASGEWGKIDDLLREVDVENTEVVYLISWLTITACVRSKLEYRSDFFNLVKDKIKKTEPRLEDVLLSGLE